ncbi:UNVERIFIED_CONTAM: hypothetical protein Slati_0207400, partial [Sesamum latifolium]
EFSTYDSEDQIKIALKKNLTSMQVKVLEEFMALDPNIGENILELEGLPPLHFNLAFIDLPQSHTKLLPSILQAPTLELKELPKHLKYAFLRENDTLPVIISSKLSTLEEKLIRVLREFREAIGWTIADIKGLSPFTCMHRILLKEGAKPSREAQRRLNPSMMEVVKKEILELLDTGMIFPISDSEWVSPTQVVPKKMGITVIENYVGNLVPTRVQNCWRVCIDYRKLNASTRKDHFPLPFIDQMLERLAARSHYSCLDGYSGFHQIPVAPPDQEKTTFICPFGTFAYRRMPFDLCNAPPTFQRCMHHPGINHTDKEPRPIGNTSSTNEETRDHREIINYRRKGKAVAIDDTHLTYHVVSNIVKNGAEAITPYNVNVHNVNDAANGVLPHLHVPITEPHVEPS